jgi:hypothetical protein
MCSTHVVAPRELLTVTSRYAKSMVFCMDDLLIDGCVGLAIHRSEHVNSEDGGSNNKKLSLAAFFTAEFTALFVTLERLFSLRRNA